MGLDRLIAHLPKSPCVRVTALIHGDERYVLLYDDAHEEEAVDTVVRWAMHPQLSLTLSQGIRLTQSIRGTA